MALPMLHKKFRELMLMKKIIISLSVLAVIALAAAGGTVAFFNDTETSTGNVFVAGNIDLKVDSLGAEYNDIDIEASDWVMRDLTDEKFFSFADIKPGDFGWRVLSLHVQDNPAYACFLIHDKEDDENTVVNPELVAGDTADDGIPFGELSKEIEIFAWEDLLPDAIYDPVNEVALMAAPASLFDTSYITYADSTSAITPLTGFGDTRFAALAWCAGTMTVNVGGNLVQPGIPGGTIECDGVSMGDIAQTDEFTANMSAYAEQTRNNDNFKCEDVNLDS
jgi:predicted ribosomally synthesized peptide with SipW-like signal peptide